jgi:precorrin-2/cobalt-factor-2 C20-methyltransferase
MAPRLSGVGVGPGDPELITVKAVETLRAADAAFVPVADTGEAGYAERVVRAHLPDRRLDRLTFALSDDAAAREASWDAAGQAVAETLRAGGHAAFATIGDPNLYSTFTYLADTIRTLVPEVEVDTVPGITAMQDLAARAGTVLAEGTQRLALLPFTAGPDALDAALADYDTVVSYKGGRHLPRVREAISRAGRTADAVFGARLGLAGEEVGDLPGQPGPYLSTVIVTRPRGARGGHL